MVRTGTLMGYGRPSLVHQFLPDAKLLDTFPKSGPGDPKELCGLHLISRVSFSASMISTVPPQEALLSLGSAGQTEQARRQGEAGRR